jgi:metal-responsive CopG/Arc/MetJ family transcriptional regulator
MEAMHKTAVSIPQRLFEAADRVARRRRIPRSQLYAEALKQFLAGVDEEDITAQINAAIAEEELDTTPEEAAENATSTAWNREAAGRTFERQAREELEAGAEPWP